MSGAPPRQYAIELDTAAGRLVIEALAEQPFKTVFALIGELNRQANAAPQAQRCRYLLDGAALKLILTALGALPYHRVHALLHQLDGQIGAAAAPPAAKRKRA